MVTLLVILAVLAWLFGGLLLSQATYGVGVLAAGCLLAILARIAQASNQHREVMRALGEQQRSLTEAMPGTLASTPPVDEWICMSCGTVNREPAFLCTQCRTRRP